MRENPLAMSPVIYYTHVESPFGPFMIAGTEQHIVRASFTCGHQVRAPAAEWVESETKLRYASGALSSYFAGGRDELAIPWQATGTPFQEAVWHVVAAIPYGETMSYGEVAKAVGKPKAARAVGAANGANYIPILIPCHRVVGSNGQLTGFGGGLDTKACLLEMERGGGSAPAQHDLLAGLL